MLLVPAQKQPLGNGTLTLHLWLVHPFRFWGLNGLDYHCTYGYLDQDLLLVLPSLLRS